MFNNYTKLYYIMEMTPLLYLLLLVSIGKCNEHSPAKEPTPANEQKPPFRLQILHNADLHVRFEETYGFGGFARMKQAIQDAKHKAEEDGIPTIILNGGDNFQGTPYYTVFKEEYVTKFVSALGIDVMTLGNHDFDDGITTLNAFLQGVKTTVVCANLHLESEPKLNAEKLPKSTILEVNGTKIGVIGYVTPDTMDTSKTEKLKILPEIDEVRHEAKRLKNEEGVQIIIALGHSGYEKDFEIAKEVEEVSVVVGAHTHTFMYTPKDHYPSTEKPVFKYPHMVEGKDGKLVPVVHAYAFSKYLGVLMVEFDDKGNVLNATGNPLLLDNAVQKEPKLDEEIFKVSKKLEKEVGVLRGYAITNLHRAKFGNGSLSSPLANLITDAFVDIGVQYAKDNDIKTWTQAAIAFQHSGGIRSKIENKNNGGNITLGDLMNVLPYENSLYQFGLSGRTIRDAMERSVSCYEKLKIGKVGRCHFLHFSGLRVKYDFSKDKGQQIESIETLCVTCPIPKYEILRDEEIYQVITMEYLADGGDGFDSFKKSKETKVTSLDVTDLKALELYVQKVKNVYVIDDNRAVVTNLKVPK